MIFNQQQQGGEVPDPSLAQQPALDQNLNQGQAQGPLQSQYQALQEPVWTQPQPLFQTGPTQEGSQTAMHFALPLRPGHFDEMRSTSGDPAAPLGLDGNNLRAPWKRFFDLLGESGFADLDHRLDVVARQIRENGITYNVYADTDGPSRPWSLDLLPFIITDEEWSKLEAGISQRAALLNAVLGDIYGPQHLLAEGLLPPALVYGHPGYLRPMRGFRPAGNVYLHIAAFDLARGPDGQWSVVTQRTQAPSGLGYALENRLTISRLFPEAFRELRVQHLAASYRRLLDMLYELGPNMLDGSGSSPRIVLLTPGPYNETYFEHAYLARYLGLPLVEGGDLVVREDMLYLKTMRGLERVHAVLRRLDDDYCDPLELRSDSTLGIPGLLQAMRAGNVLIANSPGSGFLESPAINGFLPAVAQRLLGAPLQLPSLRSWWCGEMAAREQILPDLASMVVKATFPKSATRPWFEPFIGADATPEQLDEWRARIASDPDAYTVQDYLPLSQAPTWTGGRILPRAAMVRVFAIADGNGGWYVLPGGLTRIASRDQQIVSMQRGGGSLDTWVMTADMVDEFSMLPEQLKPEDLVHKHRPVSSRAAENLFWMGRYTERAEYNVRLTRLALNRLTVEDEAPEIFFDALAHLCRRQGLLPGNLASTTPAPRQFERLLVAGLPNNSKAFSVGFNLSAMAFAAGQIRDRLSPEHWRLIVAAGEEFSARPITHESQASLLQGREAEFSTTEAVAALEHLGTQLYAITGAQTDRMTRDDGWRLLTIGRQIERLVAMTAALGAIFQRNIALNEKAFALLLGLFDSTITYRSHYQRRQEIPALLDLLVFEPANPRSIACVLNVLRSEVARLPDMDNASLIDSTPVIDFLRLLPIEGVGYGLVEICERDSHGRYPKLLDLVSHLNHVANQLSDEIGKRYFSHASDTDRMLAA